MRTRSFISWIQFSNRSAIGELRLEPPDLNLVEQPLGQASVERRINVPIENLMHPPNTRLGGNEPQQAVLILAQPLLRPCKNRKILRKH